MQKNEPYLKIEQLPQKARQIRKLVLQMCVRSGTGHVTSSFSCAEILVSLYYGQVLRYRPDEPKWPGRDRFVLSKGHASPILYAILADLGFFPRAELQKFCQSDGLFGVHLQHDVPGVEITSGSLGQGLGIACGLAKAAKMDAQPQRIFTLLGDGECYEGSIWEAAMFAGHHRLDNLLAIIDRNRLCVTGFTEEIVRLAPLDEKFRAFGWQAFTVDGHSFTELLAGIGKFMTGKLAQPVALIANTVKGKGVSFMENQPLWHGLAPSGKEAEKAKQELDQPLT